tara:strand:- start:961 stop:1524 length:564 start_codon:yes stop_codon:yes gene_type:complete
MFIKHCIKPLQHSVCLLVLLFVSGCSSDSLVSLQNSKLAALSASIKVVTFVGEQFDSPFFLNANMHTSGSASIDPPTHLSAVKTRDVQSSGSISAQHNYLFALQLASVNSEKSLAIALRKMQRLAPHIFQGSPILNMEVADIDQHTYYRLKFGGYKYLKNAKADCEAIKRQGIDCWVSSYTDNRVNF